MPKGERRSNREIRKPKKAKAGAAPAPLLGAQVKVAGNSNTPGRTSKK